MSLIFALIAAFIGLLLSVLNSIPIAYPLFFSLCIISLTLIYSGFSAKSLFKMAVQSSQKVLPVFRILLLIGAITSTWIAAGTVPFIVYYGIQFIHPHGFILSAFLLTSLVSFLIGTSFGAASTIGLALMVMAKTSSVDPHIIAGAVIAGAYFGDRCSPMSSSAYLIATLTKTDLYTNLKNMMRTGILPFVVACLIYGGLSLLYPVQITNQELLAQLTQQFDLHPIVLLPAVIILSLAVFRVPIQRSMMLSIAAAVILATAKQHYSIWEVIQFAAFGFQLEADSPLRSMLVGGGIGSMAKVCGIVVISTAIAGILAGTHSLQLIQHRLGSVKSRGGIFLSTALIGTATAAFGCSQTIAILLTEQLVQPQYARTLDQDRLALDLENTVVVLAPLIPWNIAGLVPATVLMTDQRFIPYAVYLYLIPLLFFVQTQFGWSQRFSNFQQLVVRFPDKIARKRWRE